MRRRILAVGYYGRGNLGDDAILAAVHARLVERVPDLQLTATAGPGRLPDGVPGVDPGDLVAMNEAVRGCDLLVLGGGGLLQDYWPVDDDRLLTAGQGGLVQYLAGPVLAHLHGRPSVLLSVGVGPLSTADGRRQAATAVELTGGGTVRDAASLAIVESLVPDASGVTVAADPAFLLGPVDAADDGRLRELGLPTDQAIYAVSLRPWPPGSGSVPVWLDAVAAALTSLVRTAPGHLALFPFDETPDGQDDRALADALAQRCSDVGVTVMRSGSSPLDVAGLLARCDLVLAMRYHAAVLASLSGTPSLCLAYDPKVQQVAEQLGLPWLPATSWDLDGLTGGLTAAGAVPRAAVAGRATELAASARGSLDAVVARLDAPPAAHSSATGDGLARELALRRSFELLKATEDLGRAASAVALAGSERAAAVAERDGVQAQKEALQLRLDLAAVERDLAREAQSNAELRQSAEARRASDAAREAEQRVAAAEEASVALRLQVEAELHALQDELAAAQLRLRSAEEDLRLVKASPAYRLAAPVWRAGGRVMPLGSRRRAGYHRMVGQLRGPTTGQEAVAVTAAGSDPLSALDHLEALARFDREVRRRGAQTVVLILSGTQLREDEGQRPTQLALELARLGVGVVFAYWRWDTSEWCAQDRLDDNVLQIPIDAVVSQASAVSTLFEGLSPRLLIAFPHPSFFELLARTNAAGWSTVYDVLDDWEQFHEVGQAVWWDAGFEEHVTRSAGVVTAINRPLAELVGGPAGRRVDVVPNGLRPGIERVLEPRVLERGEVTIGYFGHLTPAWFDWELLSAAAVSEPTWRFYVIGYGGDPSTALPSNVVLLGRQPQTALSGYAANWDIGIVPFRQTRLAECADPIKVYEYLAMGLPVAVTGVHPPPGSEELVLRAHDAPSFVAAIRSAVAGPADVEARKQYAADSTWASRASALLALCEAPTRPAARL